METFFLLQNQNICSFTYSENDCNTIERSTKLNVDLNTIFLLEPTVANTSIAVLNIWKTQAVASDKSSRSWEVQIEIGFHSNRREGSIRIRDVGKSGVLETLSQKFGDRLKLKVNITDVQETDSAAYGTIDLNMDNENGVVVSLIPTLGVYGCEMNIDLNFKRPAYYYYSYNHHTYTLESVTSLWNNTSYKFHGNVSITATVSKDERENVDDQTVTDKLCINKRILTEQIGCDVTIIPQNGVNIKCHKSFLLAHSSVFETMFQSSMQESKTNIVEILDMTEESVRALLAYLYYWEIQNAQKNSLICFELLHAGHKYDIGRLENCMKNILLSNDSYWYDVDVAMRLFLFSRNLEGGSELKMKAIQVLKSKFSILEQSESYRKLFEKDPKAAMELCKYAFSV